MTTSEPEHLNNHQRDTLRQILQRPTGHNLEWQDVLSLLEAIGGVELRHDGKYLVKVGTETETFVRPRGKDVDVQQVVDLRRMLAAAGYGSAKEGEATGPEA